MFIRYTLTYYCALAILAKFGVESRSQRCTAAFLRYAKDNGLIGYDDEFIDRITVYSAKEEKSDVDERETARYGSSISNEEVEAKYDYMADICKKAISQGILRFSAIISIGLLSLTLAPSSNDTDPPADGTLGLKNNRFILSLKR